MHLTIGIDFYGLHYINGLKLPCKIVTCEFLSSRGTSPVTMLVLQIPVLAEKDMTNDLELYLT